MTKDAYPALFHFIHKRMADIAYPATKGGILTLAGERLVNIEWDKTVPLRIFIEPIAKQQFSCAADFYCALIASFQPEHEDAEVI